jgi:hypothetical protein
MTTAHGTDKQWGSWKSFGIYWQTKVHDIFDQKSCNRLIKAFQSEAA